MARVSRMVSDLTGESADESEFIQLIVKAHPSIISPRQLDVLPAEVENLKTPTNLVALQIKNNGESTDVVMTLAEFRKLCKDEVVEKAQGTRGRRAGSVVAPRPTPAPSADDAA